MSSLIGATMHGVEAATVDRPAIPRWLSRVYRLRDHLDRMLTGIAVAALAAAVTLTFVATLARTATFLPDLTWTDEFTRYAIITAVLLVVPMGLRRGTQITVGFTLEAAPRTVFRLLTVLNNILMLVFFAVITVYGFKVAQLNAAQHSPLLGISLRYLYLVVALSGALLMLESILRIVEAARDTAPRPSQTQAMTSAPE